MDNPTDMGSTRVVGNIQAEVGSNRAVAHNKTVETRRRDRPNPNPNRRHASPNLRRASPSRRHASRRHASRHHASRHHASRHHAHHLHAHHRHAIGLVHRPRVVRRKGQGPQLQFGRASTSGTEPWWYVHLPRYRTGPKTFGAKTFSNDHTVRSKPE